MIRHLLTSFMFLALMGAMISCDDLQDNFQKLLDESLEEAAIPLSLRRRVSLIRDDPIHPKYISERLLPATATR